MSTHKSICFLLLFVFVVAFCSKAIADSAFEKQAKSLSKKYDNNDSVSLSCKGKKNEVCLLKVSIDGVKKRFILDFGEKNYVPTLDFVRMIGASSKPWATGLAISVECGRRDEAVLEDNVQSASCYTYVALNGNGKSTWQEFLVVGQMMPQSIDKK